MKKPQLQELKNIEKANKKFKKKYTEKDELLNVEEVYELNKNYEMNKEVLAEIICNLEEQESEYESDDD